MVSLIASNNNTFWYLRFGIKDVLLNSCNQKLYEESLSAICKIHGSWEDLGIQLEQLFAGVDVNDISISELWILLK